MDLAMQMLIMQQARIEVIKQRLLREWPVDTETRNSLPMKNLFIKWENYIKRDKENLTMYEELKKSIRLLFGNKAVEWLVLHTTYLVRDKFIRSKYKVDHVANNSITLINYGLT